MSRQYNKTGKYSICNNELKCEICGYMCKNIRSLEAHLRTAHNFKHNNLLYEDYYIKYLKKDNEGICAVCGKPTTLHKFKYDKCCSKSCAAKYSRQCRTNKKLSPEELRYNEYDKLFSKQIKNGLHIDINSEEVFKEWEYFKNKSGDINAQPIKNKIVLRYQQDNFYQKEKELFSNDRNIRNKLIDNRIKYLYKPAENLTDFELLRGFKISRIGGNRYSHFSPLWTKYFAEKYNLKYVADPFGGWGHHMIGFAAANCNYIYNDLSHSTVEGVRKINNFLNTNYIIVEGDARDFIIPYKCDSVFMCPPYYNTEIYECGEFKSKEEYDNLMYDVFDNIKSSNIKYLGIIIREDYEYLFNKLGHWNSKEPVNYSKDHFSKNGKINEYLYCWMLK